MPTSAVCRFVTFAYSCLDVCLLDIVSKAKPDCVPFVSLLLTSEVYTVLLCCEQVLGLSLNDCLHLSGGCLLTFQTDHLCLLLYICCSDRQLLYSTRGLLSHVGALHHSCRK